MQEDDDEVGESSSPDMQGESSCMDMQQASHELTEEMRHTHPDF